MVSFFAMPGNSCLAVVLLIVFLRMFCLIKVRSFNFCIKRGVRKLPQSFFLVEVGPPNNDYTAYVSHFNSCLCVF